MTTIRNVFIALSLFIFACKEQAREQQTTVTPANGFASPIPLPPVANITVNDCVERIITQGMNANTWNVNGEELVDLGIFHIHDGIEHLRTDEACAMTCAGSAKEAHLVLGPAMCKMNVLGMPFPNTGPGRIARANKMLEDCGRAVISFAVCLNGNATSINLGDIWNTLQNTKMCQNWGGPTGTHSPHQGMVQWIHYREYCGSLTNNANNITASYEPGKCHVSPTAGQVAATVQDKPICGYDTHGPCSGCGHRHQRCCNMTSDPWFWQVYPMSMDGCNTIDGISCQNGRCVPAPQPIGCAALGGGSCHRCIEYNGCVWEDNVCVATGDAQGNEVTTAAGCDALNGGCAMLGGSSCFSCIGYDGCVWQYNTCISVVDATSAAISTWDGCNMLGGGGEEEEDAGEGEEDSGEGEQDTGSTEEVDAGLSILDATDTSSGT